MNNSPHLCSSLYIPSTDNHIHCIREWILTKEEPLNQKDDYGMTMLHWASRNGHFECINILLQNGANINGTDRCEYTSLHHAASLGHFECVERLLDNGADVHIKSSFDSTPLDLSSERMKEFIRQYFEIPIKEPVCN